MSDFISEIKDRRVLPALGVYIGSCWVLIEILDRLVERYLLSPYLTDLAFWGLYSLIPAVVLIAWTHGKPGKDRVTRAEKVGVPINLIATLGLLMTLFSGKDLGATANLVTVSDEYGETVTRYVAKESYRRRVAMFFWENDGDAEHDWMQYGITELLSQDLQQSPFIVATSPFNSGSGGYYARMKQAGFEDGLGLPVSLMRQIAQAGNRQHFVDGSYEIIDGEYLFDARIWDAQTGQLLETVSERSYDPYEALDGISRGIRSALEVPSDGRAAEDLRLGDTYGESETAMQAYTEGLKAKLFDNDLVTAEQYFDAALEADPQFVMAWFAKGYIGSQNGNVPAAQQAFDEAAKLDFRLPALDRALVRANQYWLAGEIDKLKSFLRMQVKLNDDARSWRLLGSVLTQTGETAAARDAFQATWERDSSDTGTLLQLAMLERALGNPDEAVAHIQEYLELRPEDGDALLMLGDVHLDRTEFDAAETAYREAQFLDGHEVDAALRLSQMELARGEIEAAWQQVGAAAEQADTAPEISAVLGTEAAIEAKVGRLRDAIETTHLLIEQQRQFLPPLAVALGGYIQLAYQHLHLGEIDAAWEAVNAARAMLTPPMDDFLGFPAASIYAHEDQFDEAWAALARAEAITGQFQLAQLTFQIHVVAADIAREQANYELAAERGAEAIAALRESVVAGMPGLSGVLCSLHGQLAADQVLSGDLSGAQKSLETGFQMEPSNPYLWMARSRLQLAQGQFDLARASIDYTLALWREADPEFFYLKHARDIAARIDARLAQQ